MHGLGHVRTELSGVSVPRRNQERRVGGCRALNMRCTRQEPIAAQNNHTHDNRHLPSLCGALDVSSAEL